MSNQQSGNAGWSGNKPDSAADNSLARAQKETQIQTAGQQYPPPHQENLRTAIRQWRAAEQIEKGKQSQVHRDLESLKDAQKIYDSSKDQLETAQVETEQHYNQVANLLEKVTNETLVIVEPEDDSVFQGASATFTARRKYELDKDLVRPFWKTAGLPIIRGQHTDTIEVDTTNVGPGEYDINVSLELVTSDGHPPTKSAQGSASASAS